MIFKRSAPVNKVSKGIGNFAVRPVSTHAAAKRRDPDPKTTKAFTKMHLIRERFSVDAINQALAKARTIKTD